MASENQEYTLENRASEFIETLARSGSLRFQTTMLKSGRISPYFIDFGEVKGCKDIFAMGKSFARTIQENFPPGSFNVIFGPAYKGISIANAVAMNLPPSYDNVEISYNRKEAKTHGERGVV